MSIFTFIYLFMFFFGFFFLFIFLILHFRYLKYLYWNPKPSRFPLVSFLVPAYNEQNSIENTVNALIALDYPTNKKEIIIINDGSTDNTLKIARMLENKFSSVKVLNKKNSGKANSLNEAIKIAKGELFAVVDADSYPKEDSLKKMIGYFEEDNVAAVTSRVLVKNKNNLLSKFQLLDYSIIAWTRKLLDFVDSVYVTNGPLSVYRASVVRKIGGFDPKNLTEDIEITWHILSQGYQTRMAYSAIVYTTVPEKFKVWVKQRVRWNLGGIQTVIKYYKTMFKNNAFGYFVVPYVTTSFALALIGFLLFFRYLWIKGSYYLVSLYYSFFGYNLFNYMDLSLSLTVLFLFGALFFIISIIYYKIGFKHSETGNQNIFNIIIYSFIYRSLYIVPLIIALYKLMKNDIQWYTK